MMARQTKPGVDTPTWDRETFGKLLEDLFYLWKKVQPQGRRDSQNAWCVTMGIDPGILSAWKTGRSRPSWEGIRAFANRALTVYDGQRVAEQTSNLDGLRAQYTIDHPKPEKLPANMLIYKTIWRYSGFLEPAPTNAKARTLYEDYLAGNEEYRKFLWEEYQNSVTEWERRKKAGNDNHALSTAS